MVEMIVQSGSFLYMHTELTVWSGFMLAVNRIIQ